MAARTPAYSHLISCIHDEPEPIGSIGRGTHYSVFRAAEWHDVMRRPLTKAQVHDFAVIWDEDHDTRVIEAVEKLYMKSLLSPVQFIGERKGSLSIIVAAKFFFGVSNAERDAYRLAVRAEASLIWNDSWSVEIGSFDRSELDDRIDTISIIQEHNDFKVKTYLRNIDALWGLGTRDYVPPTHPEAPHPPTQSVFASVTQIDPPPPTPSLFKGTEQA
jgi:hypothetical protein